MFSAFRRRRAHRELLRAFEASIPAPSTELAMDGEGDAAPAPPSAEGPEVYRLDAEEPWSVRDDSLAERLGLRSNHAAEKKVQRELGKLDADLLARVEFDSEADCFFAYLESEQDALALRDFLHGMK